LAQAPNGGPDSAPAQDFEEEEASVEGDCEVEDTEVEGAFNSGVGLLVRDENSQGSNPSETPVQGDVLIQREAAKLLVIQKSVGFSFDLDDTEVCEKMVEDEKRDRAQKMEREIGPKILFCGGGVRWCLFGVGSGAEIVFCG
jgi:hypothetical protein